MRHSHIAVILVLVAALVPLSCGEGKRPPRASSSEEVELNRCLRLSAKKKHAQAVECLELFKSRYPASSRAAEAELRIGDSYFRNKEYLLAAESYSQFLKLHPLHERADYAYYRMGLSYLKETPESVDRDQQYLSEAISALETVWEDFPLSPYAKIALNQYNEARNRAANRDFYVGRFYYRTREYRAALPRLAAVIENYPETALAPEAAYLKLHAHMILSERDDAQSTLDFLEVNFPKSPYTDKGRKELGSATRDLGSKASEEKEAKP